MSDARETLELISFCIDGQEFCIDIMAVREIRGWTAATPLPHSPPYVCGVINLRGAVLPVVDMKARLGLGVAEPQARSVIIVVHVGARLLGLLVDAVSEIIATEPSLIQPVPNVGCDTVSRFIKGIIPLEGRMVSWVALDDVAPEQDEEVRAA